METESAETASAVARKYLRLQTARNVGPVCTRKLIEHFGTIDRIFEASIGELERVDDVGRYRAQGIIQARGDDTADGEIAAAAKRNVRIICYEDEEYPKLLRHIPDPPVCLYVRGRLQPEDGVAMAVVGARRCSRYGAEQAHRFGALLAQAGFTVVSGLAWGADGGGHRGALSVSGRTVAVLGCGLGHIYPEAHAELAEEIVQNGAVISELPMDTVPDGKNFPPRNRIIVGMSLGVIVVEAGSKSGGLISARLGNEYNREVFAIPGLLGNPMAIGTNALIRDGHAKLITCLEDVLDELGDVGRLMQGSVSEEKEDQPVASAVPANLDENGRAVLNSITFEETPLESICEESGLSPSAVAATLTKLQLQGLIAQHPGNLFVRRRVR